jgi:hypothetical protein
MSNGKFITEDGIENNVEGCSRSTITCAIRSSTWSG